MEDGEPADAGVEHRDRQLGAGLGRHQAARVAAQEQRAPLVLGRSAGPLPARVREGAGDFVDLALQHPRADQRPRQLLGAVQVARAVPEQIPGQVRHDGRRDRRRGLADVEALQRELHPVRLGVGLRRLERGLLAVTAGDRRPAELGRRDREDAGAGAPVGDRPGRLTRLLELDQQREAEAGRRVAAGAEGAAGIDDDVDQAVLRVPPRGANADPAGHLDRAVEVGPAIGPVIRNRGGGDVDEAAARRRLELAELRDLAGRAVDRELDPARAALLLEPVGGQLEQVRHHPLRVLRLAADREADHLRGEGCLSPSASASRSAASRCSGSRSVGTTSSKTTC